MAVKRISVTLLSRIILTFIGIFRRIPRHASG